MKRKPTIGRRLLFLRLAAHVQLLAGPLLDPRPSPTAAEPEQTCRRCKCQPSHARDWPCCRSSLRKEEPARTTPTFEPKSRLAVGVPGYPQPRDWKEAARWPGWGYWEPRMPALVRAWVGWRGLCLGSTHSDRFLCQLLWGMGVAEGSSRQLPCWGSCVKHAHGLLDDAHFHQAREWDIHVLELLNLYFLQLVHVLFLPADERGGGGPSPL